MAKNPTAASKLESNTTAFWEMSFTWNNRPGRTSMTVSQGIAACNKILKSSNPARPLARRAAKLLHDIINKQDREVARKKQG